MRNFKVKMAYDGSCYHGFQRQDNAITVQEKVEDALFTLLGEKITIDGCSRTDTGVHAREFYFSFKSESPITLRGIVFGLNPKLPPDISILSAEEAPMDFHARFDSKGKEYEYIVHNSEIKNPFYKNTALKYWVPIDEKKLDTVAKDFIGEHDFKSFCSTACDKQITVRTIYDARVIRDGDLVKFYISGNGFLYNMVRIMVGTLLFINEGKIPTNGISEIIKAKDRTKAGKTVAPQGLYLNRVFY